MSSITTITEPTITAIPRDDPNANVLSTLKAETAAEHARLEEHLDLLRPTFKLPEYVALLKHFYGYYEPWERTAEPLVHQVFPGFFPLRAKTNLLLQDLHHFKVNELGLPRCLTVPPLNTVSQLLGSMYVLEGSSLGGQILSRHFAEHFNLEDEGLAFFRGYGQKTGFMWKEFCDALVQRSVLCEDTAIVSSAKETFDAILNWLDGRTSA